jgi:hypothetical protein
MEERISIDLDEGLRLDGRLGMLAGARAGLVVCHPHPLYGGDMDNPVVIRAAEVAREAGLATLRFNFRGVGDSGGRHDHGEREQHDVRASLAALRARLPDGSCLGLAGYSFGAWVAARVACQSAGLAALGLIAPPLSRFDFAGLLREDLDLLLVAGTHDQYCSGVEIERLASQLPGTRPVSIDGADHFFFGKLFPLGEAIRSWVLRWSAR